LVHSAGIKSLIDHAWGVGHVKHKKKEPADAPIPDPSDPFSRESLSYSPLGQDNSRKRYWVVDGMCSPLSSPRAVFTCICADHNHLCIPLFSNPAAFAVRYLISTYDVALAHAPGPFRFTQGLPVDQPLEGHINSPNCIFYERGIRRPDRESESIRTSQAQVESGVCAPKSHCGSRRALRSY
jgi:hypothetical protein